MSNADTLRRIFTLMDEKETSPRSASCLRRIGRSAARRLYAEADGQQAEWTKAPPAR